MLKTVIFKDLTMSKAALNIANIDLLAPRTELHDKLNLSGCEVPVNNMAPGAQSPFVHHHTDNEECYLVIKGDGKLFSDGEYLELKEGSVFRMSPSVKRAIKAGDNGLSFICIQAQENSLKAYTFSDGKLDNDVKPQW